MAWLVIYRWSLQKPGQLNPDVFDPATWGAWLTLDDQNGLNWAFFDQNVLNNYIFFPTYFFDNPDTAQMYTSFKGYQLSVNTGTLVSSPFTAASVSGSDSKAPDPSQTYSVTVQHVCVANQPIHNPIKFQTAGRLLKRISTFCTVLYRENAQCSTATSLDFLLRPRRCGPCRSLGSTSAATGTLRVPPGRTLGHWAEVPLGRVPLGRTSIGGSAVRSYSSRCSIATSKLMVVLLRPFVSAPVTARKLSVLWILVLE